MTYIRCFRMRTINGWLIQLNSSSSDSSSSSSGEGDSTIRRRLAISSVRNDSRVTYVLTIFSTVYLIGRLGSLPVGGIRGHNWLGDGSWLDKTCHKCHNSHTSYIWSHTWSRITGSILKVLLWAGESVYENRSPVVDNLKVCLAQNADQL